MRHILIATFAALLTVLPVQAEEPADTIQGVIVSQLDAFGDNDLNAAFAHASPMIQSKFQTPEIFGRMVREGYPMIWRPSSFEMRELQETDWGLVQPVLFQDGVGRSFEAYYEMQQIEGVWRINGVYMREIPGVGS
ncbi:MAG: DUF4864 domain-containing protein [Paracoccaceae bacterium]|nr:DUF4864 domain-containing protein [Paracoccaceae bacterium]